MPKCSSLASHEGSQTPTVMPLCSKAAPGSLPSWIRVVGFIPQCVAEGSCDGPGRGQTGHDLRTPYLPLSLCSPSPVGKWAFITHNPIRIKNKAELWSKWVVPFFHFCHIPNFRLISLWVFVNSVSYQENNPTLNKKVRVSCWFYLPLAMLQAHKLFLHIVIPRFPPETSFT